MNDYWVLLQRSWPEVVLTLTAFGVLAADMIWLKNSSALVRLRATGVLTLIGLVIAGALAGTDAARLFVSHLYGGMMVANPLAALLKLIIVFLTVLVVVISMEREFTRHVGEYFAVVLFGTVGMSLLVSAEELIMIFVALELTSICLYVLTAFHKTELRSAEAAAKYFLFGALSSAFLLYGFSWIYGVTGATSLGEVDRTVGRVGDVPDLMLLTGLLFAMVGFGFKVAAVPFHLWAPDAYQGAPTPVTAFMAAGSKVAGFVVMAKFLVLGFSAAAGRAFWGNAAAGWTPVLAVLAALSMIAGNCAAIVQRNVKRMLAYSSIAHAGYVLVGLIAAGADTTGGGTGLGALLFYVVVYAVTNLGAFGVVHALTERAGGDDLEDFNGMAQRAPFLSLLLMVFLLSLAGMPPLAGFFGKFYLFAAAVQADPHNLGLLWLVWVGVLTSAVSLYYYLVVLKHIYVHSPSDSTRVTSSFPMRVAIGVSAAVVVLLGVFPSQLLDALASVLPFFPLTVTGL